MYFVIKQWRTSAIYVSILTKKNTVFIKNGFIVFQSILHPNRYNFVES